MSPARSSERGMTVIELALSFAIVGSLVAVAVPAFFRDLKASKLSEPVDGVKTLCESATAYAAEHDIPHAYPASAPLSPTPVPRGVRAVDPPGTWDQPGWKALGFRPTDDGIPHAFSFELETANGPARSTFAARAHGDLDGDGLTSTFECTGHHQVGEPAPVVDPGMVVESENE